VLKKVQVSYVELRTDQVENTHVFEIVEFKKGSPKKSATGEWDTSRCNEVVITSVCKKMCASNKRGPSLLRNTVQVACISPVVLRAMWTRELCWYVVVARSWFGAGLYRVRADRG